VEERGERGRGGGDAVRGHVHVLAGAGVCASEHAEQALHVSSSGAQRWLGWVGQVRACAERSGDVQRGEHLLEAAGERVVAEGVGVGAAVR